jgi:DNA-binding NarL/FixJ family response regulator
MPTPPARDRDALAFPMDDATWRDVQARLALAPQQTRIVELVLYGKSDKDIAKELGLTVPTIRTYLRRSYDRLDACDKLTLVLRVFEVAQASVRENCHR